MNLRIIKKTYKKIDNLAKGGNENIFLYKKLVDDIILNNEYDILYEVLLRYYKINIKEFSDYADIKQKTFAKIRLLTPSAYEENVKRLQQRLGFYNIGLDVYSNDNVKMGQIFQKEDIYYVTTNIDTYIINGTDEFDIYKKSIDKIYLDYGN
jgi:hypothetical protein